VFGNKSLSKRIAKAVDPTLRPGETKVVSVYLHDPSGGQSIGVSFPESPLSSVVDTWIVTLTDQRVILHHGDTMKTSRSKFVGDVPRDHDVVISARPEDRPKELVLSFDGETSHRFLVPLVWRNEAAQFVAALRPARDA
jgi:hypothetical protein